MVIAQSMMKETGEVAAIRMAVKKNRMRDHSLAIKCCLAILLMTNHVHPVCIPLYLKSLAIVFKPVHTHYMPPQQHLWVISGSCRLPSV